jgi:RNA polymerase sigma-70 factor, ECF subfamily
MAKETSDQKLLLPAGLGGDDEQELGRLVPMLYRELHAMAHRYMRRQAPGHTFQTTELIHEAYLKIARGGDKIWQSKAHFFGVAAQAMRHILVDYARSKQTLKQGGGPEKVTLSDSAELLVLKTREIIALDEALNNLAAVDIRKSRVVELKFFGGLTNEEVAEVMQLSSDTVKRDWKFARNWLLRELSHAA